MPKDTSKDYYLKVWRYVEYVRRTCKKGNYPAVVVVCGINTLKQEGKSGEFLRRYRSVNGSCNPHLVGALSNLAPLEHKWVDPSRKEHTIGTCAENDAADKILSHVSAVRLNALHFSEAYRPRTRRVVKYCEVCKRTFGL